MRTLWLILLLPQLSFGCILLLNGWTPVSLSERALSADVVVVAKATAAFKERRTSAKTYTASFHFKIVHKGKRILEELLPLKQKNALSAQVYNVSNFGDKVNCYADVTVGETYFLFLTEYNASLSAKYDDIFGAAATYNEEGEHEIIKELGWDSWTTWSSCSKTCSGGLRKRNRKCRSGYVCDGDQRQRRSCNQFLCEGAVDLLSSFGVHRGTLRTSVPPGRALSYTFTGKRVLHLRTGHIFPEGLGNSFGVSAFIRPTDASSGYLISISDRTGALSFGLKVGEYLTVEYRTTQGINIRDKISPVSLNEWYQFSLFITADGASLAVDCAEELTRTLSHTMAIIPLDSVTSLGGLYVHEILQRAYHGEIKELLLYKQEGPECGRISNDVEPTARPFVQHQTKAANQRRPPTTTRPVTLPVADVHVTDPPVQIQWAPWSACSATCGQGVRTRQPFCYRRRGYERSRCPPHLQPDSEICQDTVCVEDCHTQCFHGGTCTSSGPCRCQPGYYGHHCEKVLCLPGCLNGGYCGEPNICTCLPGYTGPRCQHVQCASGCRNGGFCIRPNICSCPIGFEPPTCTPRCRKRCRNGGKCIWFDRCQCNKPYYGRRCEHVLREEATLEIPETGKNTKGTCPQRCFNGGACDKTGTCQCKTGFAGTRCQHRICTAKELSTTRRKKHRSKCVPYIHVPCGGNKGYTCFVPRIWYRKVSRSGLIRPKKCQKQNV